jgi:DNA-directed RNA polymerase subunit RPC12/RpoP
MLECPICHNKKNKDTAKACSDCGYKFPVKVRSPRPPRPMGGLLECDGDKIHHDGLYPDWNHSGR